MYWQSMINRPLSSFERMKIARPLHYSTDTKQWSRVLKPVLGGFPYGYVELLFNYNAVTRAYPLGIVIHNAPADRADVFMASMADEDYKVFVQRLNGDTELAKFLLKGDIMSAIDDTLLLDLWQRQTPTPVPLAKVMDPACLPYSETITK
jgi:hypothetical protein